MEASTVQNVSKVVKSEIGSMKKSSAHNLCVSLSSTQIGLSPKICVINKNNQSTNVWMGLQYGKESEF